MYALATHSVSAVSTVTAAGSTGAFHLGLAALATLPLLAFVVLFIASLVSIIASSQELGMKVVWVVLVLIAPFIGSVLWFLIGRGHARRTVAN